VLAVDENAIVKQIERTRAASIYPAVQNLILACRALGLGTVPTTNHLLYEDEVKAVLGLAIQRKIQPGSRADHQSGVGINSDARCASALPDRSAFASNRTIRPWRMQRAVQEGPKTRFTPLSRPSGSIRRTRP